MTPERKPAGARLRSISELTQRKYVLWYNGRDYVIAASATEASNYYYLHFWEPAQGAWESVPDEEIIPVFIHDDMVAPQDAPWRVIRKHPAYYWIEKFGPGYLASTEETPEWLEGKI